MKEHKNYFLVDNIRVHWNFKLLPDGFEAITLFNDIYDVRTKDDLRNFLTTSSGQIMVNHERIHMLQAKSFKLRYFTFYILYIYYWVVGLIKNGTQSYMAYYSIPFEKEAYANENDFNYSKSEWKKYK